MYLDFGLTLVYRLMKEANINAKQAGERGISAKSVKKVTAVRNPICYGICCSMLCVLMSLLQLSLSKFKG